WQHMQNRLPVYMILAFLLLIILAVFSLMLGVYDFTDNSIWKVLTGAESVSSGEFYVLYKIRLPRIVMAVLIGSALAVSGTCIQGMFKNPLATPSLIGVTSGASLFAAVSIVLGSFVRPYLPEVIQYSLISIMAFLRAVLTMMFVYRVSTSQKKANVMIMLLAGVAISALAGAITGFLTYLTDDEQLRDLTFWTLGSL